ncbi:MAG: superfamily I DNA/RNA helicase [Alcaligenaceae bacterium]|nr:MAG: superfamily I DNA/RNA helicase [Alcaligenaceae bacterium]
MKTNWFYKKAELDNDQKAFVNLPLHGRYSLVGPPGSGKTNLLLLRALVFAGSGEKNVLIITYTRALADFIRSGIVTPGLISASQVRTYHSWATDHIYQHLGQRAIPKGSDFDEKVRGEILNMVRLANQKLPTPKLYSAIFVDEAQDLTSDELEALLSLSDNVCICGDARQGIYHRNGLDISHALGLSHHLLQKHFRIGHKIARVADRLMPPAEGAESLESSSNYNVKIYGESSANLHALESRDDQFAAMIELIRIQLDAFKDDTIGIFCGTKESLHDIRERFNQTDLSDKIFVHGVDDGASFGGGRTIHALTIHGAKGTEFRAVHLFGIEELKDFPMNRRRLGFTAITRAKTSLNAYRTGETNSPLENSFSQPTHFGLDDLLGD